MDHYIKEKLHITEYVRYQDDFLLFHNSKEYLKLCLENIAFFLDKECLLLNKKTRIFKYSDNYIFLGRNKYGSYSKYRLINKQIKKRRYLYNNFYVTLSSYISSIVCYKGLNKGKKIENI